MFPFFNQCFCLHKTFFLSSLLNFLIQMNIILLTLFTLILNLPFGYWRTNVRKFSLQFFLAIHLPIPFIILFRILSGTGFEPMTLLFTVPAFFLGQVLGSEIHSFRKINDTQPLTSCLVMDLVRVKNNIEN